LEDNSLEFGICYLEFVILVLPSWHFIEKAFFIVKLFCGFDIFDPLPRKFVANAVSRSGMD